VGIFIFRGQSTVGQTNSSNEGLLEWVERAQLLQMPLVEDLPTILPKILDMKPGDLPFFARSSYNEHGNIVITFE
jgi:hypothetical protein